MNTFLNKTTALRFLSLAVILAFLFGMDYLSTVGFTDDTASLTAALGKPKPPPMIPAEFDVPAGDLTYHKREGAKCFTPISQCVSKEYLERYPQAVEAKGKQAACYNPKMRIWALDEVILHANDAINNLGIRLEASKVTLAEVSKVTEDDLVNGFGVTLIPAGFDEPLDIPGVNGISYQCISGGPIEKTKDTICGAYTDQYVRTPKFVDLNENFLYKHKYVSNKIAEYNKNPDGPALEKLKAFMDIESNKLMLQILSSEGAAKIPSKIIKKLAPYSGGVTVTYDKDHPCTGLGNTLTPKRYIVSVAGMSPDVPVCGATGPLKSMATGEIENQIQAFEKRIKNYTKLKEKAEKEKQKILDTTPAYCALGNGTATPPPSKKDK